MIGMWRLLLALSLASLIPVRVAATTAVPIDDSGTQLLEPAVSMRWQSAVPQRSGNNKLMTGTTQVRLRMNVSRWMRHFGHIYLVLPAQPPGPISASWATEGVLRPGKISSGSRALIYAGPITQPFMQDVLTMQFTIDGTLMERSTPVNFRLEMDQD
jgi:hypothetical protein